MKLPKTFYNVVSISGAILAILSLLVFSFMFIVSLLMDSSSNYLGLFMYIIIPVFLILGLLLIPLGMLVKHKQIKKQGAVSSEQWPLLDFNKKSLRNAFWIFSFGTIVIVLLTSVGSYEAYHYTESVKFCGTTCHEVMEPQYTTFQESEHSRIACVDCHVGTGANWYVKSKMSGVKQVLAVVKDDFPRPIPSPIKDLRPAQETCEQCHWPQKFYSYRLKNFKHFLTDSLNSEWNITLKMKIGASDEADHLSAGFHWHINENVKIRYISKKEDRKKIPWVEYVNSKTGDTIIYQDKKRPLKAKKLAESTPRQMDCLDCHNRPSHQFPEPQQYIDEALALGEIPMDLPFVKRHAMQILRDPYPTNQEALEFMEGYMDSVYHAYSNKALVNTATEGMKHAFSQHVFSSMGASWDVYENHIGHKTYNGCFRCHDNKHVSAEGRIISNECSICHDIVSQGAKGQEEFALFNEDLPFKHPVEIDANWETDLCIECHRYLY